MYKKSLAALAVLGAFAGSALAADVTLYGVVDYGLLYQNNDAEYDPEGILNGDALTLDSGVNAASRIGLMGSEDLGNGYKVSFKLENGFDADDGALGDDNKLFNREARLTVEGPWGELSAGRMGALGSATGTYDTVFAIGDAFDGGDGDIFAAATTDRYNNMLTYRSPKVAGMQVTAQYSFKIDDEEEIKGKPMLEGHNSAHRYAGIALTGEYGSLQAVAAYEKLMYSDEIPSSRGWDDSEILSLGGNYDFGVVKVFAMGQYFEHTMVTELNTGDFMPPVDGYDLHTGLQLPVFGGTMTGGLYYINAESSILHKDVKRDDWDAWGVSVKYEYPLSVRTTLYGSIGYGEFENDLRHVEGEEKWDWNPENKLTQIYAGITHTF